MQINYIGKVLLIQVIGEAGCRSLTSVEVPLDGIPGDRHSGAVRKLSRPSGGLPTGSIVRNARQLSILSSEEMDAVAAELGLQALDPVDLKANMVLEGIPNLTLLPPGTRLRFNSGLSLVVEGYNAPCTKSGKRIELRNPGKDGLSARFVKSALYRRGIVAWVEKAGRVSIGDEARVIFPAQPPYPYPG